MPTVLRETSKFFTQENLIGRDLEINFRSSGNLYRGPIQFVSIVSEDQRFGNKLEYAVLELEWLAVQYNPSRLPLHHTVTSGPWAKCDLKELLTQKICLNYLRPTFGPNGMVFQENSHSMRIVNRGSNLDRQVVYTEYHIAARIAHSLYPPHPYSEMLCVGTVQNIEPREVQSQREVAICEVTFVLFAKSYEGACNWVRGECARLGLPIISLKKTRLLPGI